MLGEICQVLKSQCWQGLIISFLDSLAEVVCFKRSAKCLNLTVGELMISWSKNIHLCEKQIYARDNQISSITHDLKVYILGLN